MIELLLLLLTAILSAGAAAAARIAQLALRLAMSSRRIASTVSKLKRGNDAIDKVANLLKEFSTAADEIQLLGAKLVKRRSRPLIVKGQTKTTLKAKREFEKRDKKCRFCGSTEHPTPRIKPGMVVYD